MIFDVFKNKKPVGTLNLFKDRGAWEFVVETSDKSLKDSIGDVRKNGVETFGCNHDNRGVRALVKKRVTTDNPYFNLAFREWLSNKGYETRERDSKTDTEILGLLKRIPEEKEIVEQVKSELPNMTHLEKTLILRQLRKVPESNNRHD